AVPGDRDHTPKRCDHPDIAREESTASPGFQLSALTRTVPHSRLPTFAQPPPASSRRATSTRHAIHPHSLLGAMLPFAPSQSPPRREFPVHDFHYVRRPDAYTPPGCGVPPKAHYPKRHRGARSKSQQRKVRVPANRARYSEPPPVRSSLTPLPTHRCPWLQSNNRRFSSLQKNISEFRGRPRCVPDKRADPGKLL